MISSLSDGNWGQWTNFTSCSVIYGTGTQTRSRFCDNPAPSAGGLACLGSATDTNYCDLARSIVGRNLKTIYVWFCIFTFRVKNNISFFEFFETENVNEAEFWYQSRPRVSHHIFRLSMNFFLFLRPHDWSKGNLI